MTDFDDRADPEGDLDAAGFEERAGSADAAGRCASGPRPADAARAAVAPAASAPPPQAPAPAAAAASTAEGRPGDIAREALREARLAQRRRAEPPAAPDTGARGGAEDEDDRSAAPVTPSAGTGDDGSVDTGTTEAGPQAPPDAGPRGANTPADTGTSGEPGADGAAASASPADRARAAISKVRRDPEQSRPKVRATAGRQRRRIDPSPQAADAAGPSAPGPQHAPSPGTRSHEGERPDGPRLRRPERLGGLFAPSTGPELGPARDRQSHKDDRAPLGEHTGRVDAHEEDETGAGPPAPAAPGHGAPSAPAPGHAAPAAPAPGHAAPAAPAPAPGHAAPATPGVSRQADQGHKSAPSARTWWGSAWVRALEEQSLDAGRLTRGRAYEEDGLVASVTVAPGQVIAYVQGSRPRPYRTRVQLRVLSDAEWERFLEAAAERPGHIAALLDKDLPQSLADCGVDLLPGRGDLRPSCSCPDDGHPCKHAAALCYRTARLLDEDPFVLLRLRGREEHTFLDELSRRNATLAARSASHAQAPGTGVRATDAYAPRSLPPLPRPLPVPTHPAAPPSYPEAEGGPDPLLLDRLATDAAARAHTLLAQGVDTVGELTPRQDAVRIAAGRPGSGLTASGRALYEALAPAVGLTPSELARAVAAWRQGGLDGLAVLDEPWDPPAGPFDQARPALLAAGFTAFRPWRNRLTHPVGRVQLRYGRDGRWYAYESEPGRDDWWPRGTPDHDPLTAIRHPGTP